MAPREEVEVKSCQTHDGVICPLLILDKKVGRGIPDESEVVKGAQEGSEIGWGRGEETYVL